MLGTDEQWKKGRDFLCYCGSTECDNLWTSWGWAIVCVNCGLPYVIQKYDIVAIRNSGKVSIGEPEKETSWTCWCGRSFGSHFALTVHQRSCKKEVVNA